MSAEIRTSQSAAKQSACTKRFRTAANSSDLPKISSLCRLLYVDTRLLEVFALYADMEDLVSKILGVVKGVEFASMGRSRSLYSLVLCRAQRLSKGDAQSAINQYGSAVLLVQTITRRFKVRCRQISARLWSLTKHGGLLQDPRKHTPLLLAAIVKHALLRSRYCE